MPYVSNHLSRNLTSDQLHTVLFSTGVLFAEKRQDDEGEKVKVGLVTDVGKVDDKTSVNIWQVSAKWPSNFTTRQTAMCHVEFLQMIHSGS